MKYIIQIYGMMFLEIAIETGLIIFMLFVGEKVIEVFENVKYWVIRKIK